MSRPQAHQVACVGDICQLGHFDEALLGDPVREGEREEAQQEARRATCMGARGSSRTLASICPQSSMVSRKASVKKAFLEEAAFHEGGPFGSM